MKKIYILLFSFIFFFTIKGFSQIKDSCIKVKFISASYSYQIPGGDLVKRFGNNSNVGLSFNIKDKKNFIYGFEFNFIFGNDVKEKNLFDSIACKDGFIIDGNGEPAVVKIYERGFFLAPKFGKIFKGLGPNPNSGIMFTISPGFLQHKIRIENPHNTAPQLKGDYRKGYDRLCNGFALNEFLGFVYLGNKRLINLIAGFDFTQAFTQDRRSFDYEMQKQITTKRLDLYYGIKVYWLIPFYRRTPAKFYYY